MDKRIDWESFEIDEKLYEEAVTKNEKITDLVAVLADDELKDSDVDGIKETKAPSGGTPPPTPPTPGSGTPAPGAPKAPGGTPGGKGKKSAAPMPVSGGSSKESSKVRGIEDMYKGKYKFVDSHAWTHSGNANPTWEQIKNSKKWSEFKPVKTILKNKWSSLVNEEISETERGFLIGEEINLYDYMLGKNKFFDRITVPEKEVAELNVILALDASGSTGDDVQYYMSGTMFAVKRAFEEMGVMHSAMIYSHNVSILDVDCNGLSGRGNSLMSNMMGSGGNEEGMVLDIASEIVRTNADYKNVVILLSDGGVADVRDRLKQIREKTKGELGIYIIGYEKGFDEEYAKRIFGDEYAIPAKNPKDLANVIIQVLSTELEKALVKEGV